MSTIVPPSLGCYSACSFVFFAGRERLVLGELGVHQMWAERPDQGRLQVTLSDVVDAFEKFDVPTGVLTRMLRTDSAEMFIYARADAEASGINRAGATTRQTAGLANAATAAQWRPSPTPSSEVEQSGSSVATLRLAIYGGLDFYGQDISHGREVDLVACAAACLTNASCLNFTFNANPSLIQGPNCFLKNGYTRLESYGEALSGMFLLDPREAAPTYRVGGIDPTSDVVTGVSLIGTVLTGFPVQRSAASCRIACIENGSCAAYTYTNNGQQCRLFGQVERTISMPGTISGTKRWHNFEPIDVFDLGE